MRGRLFAKLCDNAEAEHITHLYYCETCWFSHAKVLHREFQLKEEIVIFVSDSNNSDDVELCYNEDFIQQLAYLVDIF
jgi:hypothetical protein